MKSHDLLNSLRHIDSETEVDDITIPFENGNLLASQVLANVQAGNPPNEGAVVPPPGEEVIP